MLNKLRVSSNLALALMADDPNDPYRQGYTFANALNAVAESHDLDRLEAAIVAEQMALEIARNPRDYSIFNPDPVLNA